MKRSAKVTPLTPADRDAQTVARIQDRFYRWDSTYVWHPLQLCWVIPVFCERDFLNWTWYHPDGRSVTVDLNQYDLAIVNAYLTAKRNIHMYALWKEFSELPVPQALSQLSSQPLTANIRFLYDPNTAARHQQLLTEWPVLQTEFNAARDRAFYVPTPPPTPPPSPPRVHKLPPTFRRAREMYREQYRATDGCGKSDEVGGPLQS